jgi:1-acylglycerone phosphate reductase
MPYPITSVYNATKAALLQYSETLRLEMEPLGVRVLTALPGQIATNLPQIPHLADTSIYKPLEGALATRAKEHMGSSTMILNLDCTDHFKCRQDDERRNLRCGLNVRGLEW